MGSGDTYETTIKINAENEPQVLSVAFLCKNVDRMDVVIYRKGSDSEYDTFDDLVSKHLYFSKHAFKISSYVQTLCRTEI